MRWASAPPSVAPASTAGGPDCTGVRRVCITSGTGGAGAGGAIAFGGNVEAPRSGFSMSIAPPHFEHLVRALGRSPSLDSSNLNLDWQLGQTTIMNGHLHSPRRATAGASALGTDGTEDNTNPTDPAAR